MCRDYEICEVQWRLTKQQAACVCSHAGVQTCCMYSGCAVPWKARQVGVCEVHSVVLPETQHTGSGGVVGAPLLWPVCVVAC